jgi:hypothetical protein
MLQALGVANGAVHLDERLSGRCSDDNVLGDNISVSQSIYSRSSE